MSAAPICSSRASRLRISGGIPSSISRRTAGLVRRRRISSSSASSRSSAPSSSTSRSALRVTRKTWRSRTRMPGKRRPRLAAMTSSSGTKIPGSGDTNRPEQRRDLDAREVDQVRVRILDPDGQVERQVRDVGEGVTRVDRQRREHREDARAEHGLQHASLGLVELRPAQDANALGRRAAAPAPGTARPAGWRRSGPALRSGPAARTASARRRSVGGQARPLPVVSDRRRGPGRTRPGCWRRWPGTSLVRGAGCSGPRRGPARARRRPASSARGSGSARPRAGTCHSHGEAAPPEPPVA